MRHFVVPKAGGGSLQDPSLKLILRNVGCRNVIELAEMESIEFENGSILAVPFFGEHADLDVRSKMAYVVKMGNHSLMLAADSCNIEPKLYAYVHRQIGNVEVLFLGMECVGAPLSWLYGPLLMTKVPQAMDKSRRLSGSDFQQAIRIVDQFRCMDVYVYAMGQEPWLNYVMSLKYTEQSRPIVESNKLIQECGLRGLCAERLFGEKEIMFDS